MRQSPARRAQLRREERERLEARRQEILALMDQEARDEHAETDFVTLICLMKTGQLNMLPGTQHIV